MNLLDSTQRVQAWRLFSRRAEEISTFEVIKWWEMRRVPYNLLVGAAGIFTCIMTVIVATIASETIGEPLGLPDPPILAVFAVIAYAVGANICFTGGWIAEILVKKFWREKAGAFGQAAFAVGVAFSVLITLAPSALFGGLLIARLLLR
jgi:hypothetical protein